MASKTTTVALDLEGTLISHASTMVPRPGLYDFLTFCRDNFERVVFFSFVEEIRGRAILNRLADSGHMPDWVRTAEYVHAEGGRPGAKDLRQLGVDPEQALLVDDQPQVLPREQLHRMVQVPEFKEPFDDNGSVLRDVMDTIRQKQEKATRQVAHLKLVARDTEIGPIIFADYYRLGDREHDVPLVIYVGGATSTEEYLSRFHTEPLPILSECAVAVDRTGIPGVDLLVLPFPSEPDGRLHQQLFSILLFELLRQTNNPRPERIGCVGFSLGASFASYLTFSLKQVKVLATLGGYGMVEGANESRMVGEVSGRSYRCWWNADSTGYMENLFFLQFLTRHDAAMDIVTGTGGHGFAEYAANGAVKDAFEFVLRGVANTVADTSA